MRPALAILMAAVAGRAADRLRQCCEPAVGARCLTRKEIAGVWPWGCGDDWCAQMLTESFVLGFTWRRTGACDRVLGGPIARAFLPPYASRASFDARRCNCLRVHSRLTVIRTLLFGLGSDPACLQAGSGHSHENNTSTSDADRAVSCDTHSLSLKWPFVCVD